MVDPFLSGTLAGNITWEDCDDFSHHDKLVADISELIYYIGTKCIPCYK